MRRQLPLAMATAVTALLTAPGSAVAATTCELSSGVLDVTMTATNNTAELIVASGEILVFGSVGPVTCTGGAPTVSNTNAISVHNVPGLVDNEVVLNEPNKFAPGLVAEAGDDEIEIFVNLNNGDSSELRLNALVAGASFVFGTGGINANATAGEDQPDVDIVPTMVPILAANGNSGPDLMVAQGGRGTGGPLAESITLSGGPGNDNLGGGEAADVIVGGLGRDDLKGFGAADIVVGGAEPSILSGGAGDDSLRAGTAGDLVLGDDGTDTADYTGLTGGVSVELGQNGIENVVGTSFADVLRGDGGPNLLDGRQGNDLLVGGAGVDRLEGREGDDSLEVRDGGADTADCGVGTDTATPDVPALDLLTGCENILFPALDAGPGGGPPGGGGPVGETPDGGGDHTPASVTRYRLSPSSFVAASKGPSVTAARRAKVGTIVRYTVSEPATVSFAVERATSGRQVSEKCPAPTRRSQRRKHCARYRTLKGTFEHTGRQGRNSLKFSGRLRGRKLAPGRYRLVSRATDAAGNRSMPKRVKFRIVKR
jgi:RTX calcium-binding nonapeptide repeat (4 copies)